uniref:hypothetical protein n=1 Tax=Salmonella sp. s55004 TaxID=3159675 RepID=UPI00397EFD4F
GWVIPKTLKMEHVAFSLFFIAKNLEHDAYIIQLSTTGTKSVGAMILNFFVKNRRSKNAVLF